MSEHAPYVAGQHEGGNIDWGEKGKFQVRTVAVHRGYWIPPFAMDDRQLKRVLLVRAWHYLFQNMPCAPDIEIDYKDLNDRATAKALNGRAIGADTPAIQRQMITAHVEAVRRAGGYLQLESAIAFRSWRLGQNSIEVGSSLGMTPGTVRAHIERLRDCARELGYDVGNQHHSKGAERPNSGRHMHNRDPLLRQPYDDKRLAELSQQGLSAYAIAKLDGVSRTTVTKRLKRAGLYTRCGRPRKIDYSRALELHQQGETLRAIAKEVGVTSTAVFNALKRSGYKPLRQRHVNGAKAAAMFKGGTSLTDIAVALGYPRGKGQTSVAYAIARFNEKPRP